MHTIHIFITTQRKHTQQHQQKKAYDIGRSAKRWRDEAERVQVKRINNAKATFRTRRRDGFFMLSCRKKKLLLQKSGMRAAGTKKWRTQKNTKAHQFLVSFFKTLVLVRTLAGARCAFLILLLRIRIM